MEIPGVGKKTAQDLLALGFSRISDLIGQDPELLYQCDCELRNMHIDRCQLYVYRLAVYYAETQSKDPEKLKWWYWKDKRYPPKGM